MRIFLLVIALLFSACGMEEESDLDIVGGSPAYRSWFGMMLENGKFFCGSTLIHKKWALTARHCVQGVKPNSLSIKFGAYETKGNNGGKPFKTVKVTKIIKASDGSDVALLKLGGEVKFNPRSLLDYSRVPDRAKMYVFGFGATGQGKPVSKTLLGAMVMADKKCGKYSSINHKKEFCAGHGKYDSCNGDSGGPIVYKDRLVGVVSWGKECGIAHKGYPGVYAKPNLSWIKKIAGI